jgi:hypothetical protein
MKAAQKTAREPGKSTTAVSKKPKGFTDEEKAAMRDRVQEQKMDKADMDSAVLEKIAGMKEPDRAMAKRLDALIKASAPALTRRLWYGMPAYAKDEKVICHFQDAAKFRMRYATLGFSDKASLDEGGMWPVAYALKDLTANEEARIAALVKKAVG